LYRYGSGGLKSFLLNDEAYILRKHAILLRKTEYYINTGKKVLNTIYKMRLNRFQNRYSMHIPVNCCDKGLRIMHVGPILMNSKVTVGENCCFHINTALVAGGTNDAVPTLGDGVVLGIGAIVLGGVYVADNVAIGANAVVNKDVMETNIAVAGVPAKKISNNGRNEWNKGNK
jgi:serine O-acetyltransferase